MAKSYSSVAEMMADVCEDKKYSDRLSVELNKITLSKILIAMRCNAKLTQEEIAKKIGCAQGTISKIECSDDDELSVKDLLDYTSALNFQLEIGFREKNPSVIDLIKFHAFQISRYFGELNSLVKGDPAIARGVAKFHKEASMNFNKIINRSFQGLIGQLVKYKMRGTKERLHISPPLYDNLKAAEKRCDKEAAAT